MFAFCVYEVVVAVIDLIPYGRLDVIRPHAVIRWRSDDAMDTLIFQWK